MPSQRPQPGFGACFFLPGAVAKPSHPRDCNQLTGMGSEQPKLQSVCKPPSPSAAAQPAPAPRSAVPAAPRTLPWCLRTWARLLLSSRPRPQLEAKAKPRSAIAARHCPPEAAARMAPQSCLPSPEGALSSSSHCCLAASTVLKVPQTDRTPHLVHSRFHTDELAISLFLLRQAGSASSQYFFSPPSYPSSTHIFPHLTLKLYL